MNVFDLIAFSIGCVVILGSIIAIAYFDYKRKDKPVVMVIKNYDELIAKLDEMFEKRGL